MRFKQISENEIEDTQTGLVWRKDFKKNMTWKEALDYAESLDDNWRLPTIDELISLINYTRRDPASDFPSMPATGFWSSTPVVDTAISAWRAHFFSGHIDYDYKTNTYDVRCVRDKE